MTSYADHFTLLVSTPSIVEAEASVNRLCSTLERGTEGKQLAIGYWPPEIQHDSVQLGYSPVLALIVMKALDGLSWGFTTQTLGPHIKS